MFRFLRSQFAHEQARTEDLADFFQYRQTTRSGFPNGACAMAVDSVLSLLAIGTQTGEIIVLGGANALWSSAIPSKSAIAYIYFAHGTGMFMVLCQDQSFHRFKLNGRKIEHHAIAPETRLKRITSCSMYQKRDLSDARLLIGTMTGNVFSIKIDTCELAEFILYEDTMFPNLPSEARTGTSIDGICVNQKDPRQVLIVIDQRCVLLYDVNVHQVLRAYMQTSAVTHISWCSDGVHFMVSHADGGYSRWATTAMAAIDDPVILFGPFPCTSINKVYNVKTPLGTTLMFSGGLPRASYGDRYTVTLKRSSRVAVLDFSSPVIDFIVVPESRSIKEDAFFTASSLLILCEQELLCIDLTDKSWKQIPNLYLHSLHFSQITASALCSDVEEHVWKEISKISDRQFNYERFSKKPWPIHAGDTGKPSTSSEESRQLLITGHENGIVRLWSAGNLNMRLLHTIKTSKEFYGFEDFNEALNGVEAGNRDSMYDSDSSEGNPTSEWPPFVKIGEYDPFCDDHRLAVQKLAFDASSGLLGIGGRGGHILIYQLSDIARTLKSGAAVEPQLVPSDKVPTHIGRLQPLKLRDKPQAYEVGYQPYARSDREESLSIQLRPCTAVTAVAILSSRGLVACSSEFGFAVVDIKAKQILVNCSLCSGQDLLEAGALDDALSRFKSMKKSIRQSFRRKKKATPSTEPAPTQNGTKESTHNNENSPNRVNGVSAIDDDDEDIVKPVERRIEARTERVSPEQPLWLVRVLVFSKAAMFSSTASIDCLWVGSNGGRILCYAIASRERPEDTCRLIREIRLEHAAPIINIVVQADPFEKSAVAATRLLVFTEEQIRALTLPQLKHTKYKYKLTALEGERIRKAGVVKLVSSTDRHIDEIFAYVLTNQGNVILFSLIHPKKKMTANILKVTDILGMTSSIVSSTGEVFFLRTGGSEYQRATLSKQHQDFPSPFGSSPFPPSL